MTLFLLIRPVSGLRPEGTLRGLRPEGGLHFMVYARRAVYASRFTFHGLRMRQFTMCSLKVYYIPSNLSNLSNHSNLIEICSLKVYYIPSNLSNLSNHSNLIEICSLKVY